MIIKLIDDSSPRIDGKRGKPTSITLGKEYTVVEIENDKFTILNDDFKLGRYSKFRFVVVDNTTPMPIREQFNTLTTPMRTEIKSLKNQLHASLLEIENLKKKLSENN